MHPLYYKICDLQDLAIELCDARPSMLGGSFKRLNLEEMQRYLAVEDQISTLKRQLRSEVGWWKYYTKYFNKFITAYNSTYYTR